MQGMQEAATGASEQHQQLPLPERCKSLLVGNWRAQVTTLLLGAPKDRAEAKERVHSTLARISLHPDGSPVVWLPPSDTHVVNLMLDERGSLVVGATDPPALVRALRSTGKAPARAVFVGDLLAAEPEEVPYLRRLMGSQVSAALGAAKAAGLSPAGDMGGRIGADAQGLHLLAPPSSSALPLSADAPAADWMPFRLACRTCQFIPMHGERATLSFPEVAASAPDPFALVAPALLDAFNRSDGVRQALVLFCAAYMGVELHGAAAYLVGLDRWGFNVLGACSNGHSEDGAPLWREFRFSFQAEVQSVQSFRHVLMSMEAEATE